jgi:hypothetical protein
LVFQQNVQSLNFLCQIVVVALKVLQLTFILAVCVDIILQFAYDVLELLVLLDLVAASILDRLLLLLQVAIVVES